MPYIKRDKRTKETQSSPKNRGELNWAFCTRLLELFSITSKNYDAHVEIKAIVSEILQGAIMHVDLRKVKFPEFSPSSRDVLETLDKIFWNYVAETGDCSGAKQVMRDVIHEWNRKMTNAYEDRKITENGDIFNTDYSYSPDHDFYR